MPEAIKVTVVLRDYGELYRLFPMPRFEVSAGDDGERRGAPNDDRGNENGRTPNSGDGRGKSERDGSS